ncbi:mavicyanin [Selaginella moellendorffii]|nr:mavicyanin [Selaginella moellendorffii]|eukprot:XP_002968266.2 mavicyanin [Selaginella moellendorffii]
MGRSLSLVLGLVLGFLVRFAASAALYKVGDNLGWNLNVNYTQWAAKYPFALGDSVVFVFSGSHSVLMVNEIDYVLCNIHNPVQSLLSGRAITLAARKNFFICGIPGHCITGMKVAIYASVASSSQSVASDFSSPSSSARSSFPDFGPRHGPALPTSLGLLALIFLLLVI